MIYILEDHPNDKISKLFKSAYTPEVKLNYVEGNGYINSLLRELDVNEVKEPVGIILDLVPGNPHTVKIFNMARRLFLKGKPVYPIPIPCMEYILIRSIRDSGLIKLDSNFYILENRDVHFKSELYNDTSNMHMKKNFEKFCKLVLAKNSAECIRRGNKPLDSGDDNYCTAPCICTIPDKYCSPKSIMDKAYDLLKYMPCIPAGSRFSTNSISVEDYVNILNSTIEEYNKHCELYIEYHENNGIEIPLGKYTYVKKV